MASIRILRPSVVPASAEEDRARTERRRAGVRLACPPEVAVAFLAKLYSASPQLCENEVSIEPPATPGADR